VNRKKKKKKNPSTGETFKEEKLREQLGKGILSGKKERLGSKKRKRG